MLVSVTGNFFVDASVISSTSASFNAAMPGNYALNYVVRDNLGATATGQVNVTVTGDSNKCGDS